MTIVANEKLSNIENTKNKIFNQIQELQISRELKVQLKSQFKKKNYNHSESDIEKNTDINLNEVVSEIFDK